MTIIDPMHAALAGAAKTQWYTQWILTNTLRAPTLCQPRELGMIHAFLEDFEAPLWAGRLPVRVGEPAGGSLTCDEYKFAATAVWPIIIPIVWEAFMTPQEIAEQKATKDQYQRELRTHTEKLD
ncbi:hypothetical protein C8J56DRAFT_1063290 [Mycena floridula]|nr:hypothetical protein C8J56DRAFT_1063290 [Mycena floridula]